MHVVATSNAVHLFYYLVAIRRNDTGLATKPNLILCKDFGNQNCAAKMSLQPESHLTPAHRASNSLLMMLQQFKALRGVIVRAKSTAFSVLLLNITYGSLPRSCLDNIPNSNVKDVGAYRAGYSHITQPLACHNNTGDEVRDRGSSC